MTTGRLGRKLILLLLFAVPTWAQSTKPATTKPASTLPVRPTTRPARPLPPALTKPTPETLDDLKQLQVQMKTVVHQVMPAVVGLRVGSGQGSGVIISKDGYVLTAGHVSGAPGRDCTVLLADGKRVRGKTLGVNYQIDSGLIKIIDEGTYPFVEVGTSADLKRMQYCFALGHPGGYRTGRTAPLRLGKVLSPRETSIRTDCTLVGGDSGGPLFDLNGRLIGIHSRIGGTLTDNIHVPIDTFTDTWERLAKGEAWGQPGFASVQRGGPYLGVETDTEAPQCIVTQVFPDTAAEKAGLKADDVIVHFDGQRIANSSELTLNIGKKRAGDEVTIEVKRGAETLKLKATLSRRQ